MKLIQENTFSIKTVHFFIRTGHLEKINLPTICGDASFVYWLMEKYSHWNFIKFLRIRPESVNFPPLFAETALGEQPDVRKRGCGRAVEALVWNVCCRTLFRMLSSSALKMRMWIVNDGIDADVMTRTLMWSILQNWAAGFRRSFICASSCSPVFDWS